ncbi:MAG: hypothetical protein ABW168_15970 [Sedimenticola sp.]
MKFSLLQIGQQFRLDGVIYTKSGPLQAVAEGASSHKMIMRSAVVTLLDAGGSSQNSDETSALNRERMQKAVAQYHEQCLAIVSSTATPLSTETNSQLENAYRKITALLESYPV